jgi:hypothetical protein
MIMMTGASTRIAMAKATPQAARLYLGSGRRAMTAARKGPYSAIINHVRASGTQKMKIDRVERRCMSLPVSRCGGSILSGWGIRQPTADSGCSTASSLPVDRYSTLDSLEVEARKLGVERPAVTMRIERRLMAVD